MCTEFSGLTRYIYKTKTKQNKLTRLKWSLRRQAATNVQNMGSEAKRPGNESSLCNMLAEKPWANFLASLCFSFLIQDGDNQILSSKGYQLNKLIHLKQYITKYTGWGLGVVNKC